MNNQTIAINEYCVEATSEIYKDVKKMEKIFYMIKEIFDIYIGPDYSTEGRETFEEYIRPKNIAKRLSDKTTKLIVAWERNEPVGVIEIRGKSHISLFFVSQKYQKRGLGKLLFKEGFKNYTESISVNSSPYAVTIYEKLGFKKVAGELIKNGITYIPMLKE